MPVIWKRQGHRQDSSKKILVCLAKWPGKGKSSKAENIEVINHFSSSKHCRENYGPNPHPCPKRPSREPRLLPLPGRSKALQYLCHGDIRVGQRKTWIFHPCHAVMPSSFPESVKPGFLSPPNSNGISLSPLEWCQRCPYWEWRVWSLPSCNETISHPMLCCQQRPNGEVK